MAPATRIAWSPAATSTATLTAAIHLIGELRALKPDLYINLTTGTYPSPFWLRYADSIWRGGEDHDFAGVGSEPRSTGSPTATPTPTSTSCCAGPLFPLNSLMLHGMIYAKSCQESRHRSAERLRDEVHAYFGNGTQLQEMYVTPSLLSSGELGRSGRGGSVVAGERRRAGGYPLDRRRSGAARSLWWAAWSPAQSVLVLRNPSDRPQALALDIGVALELPDVAQRRYHAHTPWKENAGDRWVDLRAGQPHTFSLNAFEVLVLDLVPSP